MRMTFPVAESIADLIYRTPNTSVNLISVLEYEFEAVRPGYKGKAATIAQLFRHSLTHTDELRSLTTPRGNIVGWRLSYDERWEHLNVESLASNTFVVSFDTTAFYDDIVAVCHKAMKKAWGDDARDRYNGWLERVLRAPTPKAEAMAIHEIDNNGLK